MALLGYYLAEGGGKTLFIFLFVVALYMVWKAGVLLVNRFWFGELNARLGLKVVGKSAFQLLLACGVSFLALGYVLAWVNAQANPEAVVSNSNFFMELDHQLFGVYVPFWLQSGGGMVRGVVDFLTPALVWAYQNLVLVTSVVFLGAFIRQQRLFYEAFLAFMLCVAVSLPVWYFLPALTPLDAYWKNALTTSDNGGITRAVASYQPNPQLAVVIGEHSPTIQSVPFVVTTFPSLHVALAVVLVVYGAYVWSPFLWVLVPYFLLNAAATMVLLQHYAVDVPAGLLVGSVAVLLAHMVVRFFHASSGQTLSDLMQADLRSVARLARQLIHG